MVSIAIMIGRTTVHDVVGSASPLARESTLEVPVSRMGLGRVWNEHPLDITTAPLVLVCILLLLLWILIDHSCEDLSSLYLG